MNELTDEEEKLLLSTTEKIHELKLVQISGFRTLVGKTYNTTLKHYLVQVYDEEEKRVERLSNRILGLQGNPRVLRAWKTRLMMTILGIKGVFEWSVRGQEFEIQDLAILTAQIRDPETREQWSKYAADERTHLERIKTAVLGIEEWETRGGGVRDMIVGVNNGLISTLAFVAGIVGATTVPAVVLLAGVAELFAGTISMAAGTYLSSKSELEVWERETQIKSIEERSMDDEKQELIKVYEAQFYPSVHVDILEELGLTPTELGNPVRDGILSGAYFGFAALIPILPFAVVSLSSQSAFTISIIATLAALFGVGGLKTIFSRKNWLRSGLEMLIIGAGAGGITYIIGKLISLIINI